MKAAAGKPFLSRIGIAATFFLWLVFSSKQSYAHLTEIDFTVSFSLARLPKAGASSKPRTQAAHFREEKTMKVSKDQALSISRRTLLAGAAIGATQIAAPFVITARAAEAIKIGVLLPKSGPYAVQGETGKNGAQIAVDDFGGQVLDRPIQIVWLDESSPQTSQQNMRKLI